jgi:DNA end-binding protein Ku
MMLYTLRFAAELRDAREYSKNLEIVQADAAQLNLAKQLIEAYTQPFDLTSFKDGYEEALRELVEAKMHNLPVSELEAEKKTAKVVDLMEALRKSLLLKKPVQSVKIATEPAEPEPVVKGIAEREAARGYVSTHADLRARLFFTRSGNRPPRNPRKRVPAGCLKRKSTNSVSTICGLREVQVMQHRV